MTIGFSILIIYLPLLAVIFGYLAAKLCGLSKVARILMPVGCAVAYILLASGYSSLTEAVRDNKADTLQQLEEKEVDLPSTYSFMQNQGSDIFEKITLGILSSHENTSPEKLLGPARVFGILMLIFFKFWLIISAWLAIALVPFFIFKTIFSHILSYYRTKQKTKKDNTVSILEFKI